MTIGGNVMLPTLRTKLNGVSARNKSLQDILQTSNQGERVLSVEAHQGGQHNTKITLEMPDKEKRVHFYNRLNLSVLLPENLELKSTLAETIHALNLAGYDFTSDDLELVDGVLQAKATSLGYYGGIMVEEPLTAILDHQGGQLPNFSMDWNSYISSEEFSGYIYFHRYEFVLSIGSRPEPIKIIYTPEDETTLQEFTSNSNGFIAGWLTRKWDELDLYDEMSLMVSSQNSPGFMVQNLLDEPNSFELVVTRQASLSSSGPVITQTPLRMGRYDMLPFGERIAPESLFYPEEISMIDSATHYDSNEWTFKRNGVRPSLFEVSVNEREYVEVEGDEFSVDVVEGNSLEHIVYNALTAAGYGNMFWASSLTLHNSSLDYLSIKIRATFGNEVLVVFDAELGTRLTRVEAEMPVIH